MSPSSKLIAIKSVHTAVWAFFVVCIAAVWVFALRSEYAHAFVAAGIVMLEVLVLALNRMHCPLTPLAARYTADRRPNFDIYLPEWLAGHTKPIFGPLYAGGLLLAIVRWSLS